jgi:hypothetical protein
MPLKRYSKGIMEHMQTTRYGESSLPVFFNGVTPLCYIYNRHTMCSHNTVCSLWTVVTTKQEHYFANNLSIEYVLSLQSSEIQI